MAFCGQCGTHVDDSIQFCPNCGAQMGLAAAADASQSAAGPAGGGQSPQVEWAEKLNRLNDTPDRTAEFSQDDIEKNKGLALLSYLGILVLVPIFAAKDSAYARFHANQGLLLIIAAVAWSVAVNIVTGILRASWSWLGTLVGGLLGIASIVFLAAVVVGIINAVGGKAKELPFIGKYRILK